MGNYLVLVLMVVIGALVLIAQLYFLWLIGRREDAMQLPEVAPAQPPPAQAAAATKRLAGGDKIVFDTFIQEKAKEEGGCAICLVEYKDGETLATITVCKHRYHVFCIRAWLKEHDTCPLCRTQV
ncbi:hypothetical protein ACP275_04G188900 [Erythranthe tilingii]